jgi:hypothetical protein
MQAFRYYLVVSYVLAPKLEIQERPEDDSYNRHWNYLWFSYHCSLDIRRKITLR